MPPTCNSSTKNNSSSSKLKTGSTVGKSRCRKPSASLWRSNNWVPRHFVKMSAILVTPGWCFNTTCPSLTWDLNHIKRISMCLERRGKSSPCTSCNADELSDSTWINGSSNSLTSPIPHKTRWTTRLMAVASCVACWRPYNSASHELKAVACCCFDTERIRDLLKKIACPDTPLRLLNRYGACDASVNTWRKAGRTFPSEPNSTNNSLVEGNSKITSPSPNKNLNTAFRAASVPWVGFDCWLPINDNQALTSALVWDSQSKRPSPFLNLE